MSFVILSISISEWNAFIKEHFIEQSDNFCLKVRKLSMLKSYTENTAFVVVLSLKDFIFKVWRISNKFTLVGCENLRNQREYLGYFGNYYCFFFNK